MRKKTLVKKVSYLVLGIFVLGALVFHSSATQATNDRSSGQQSRDRLHGKTGDADSKTPLTVHLSMTGLPTLGETAEVECVVSAAADARDVIASIQVPEDAVVISGTTDWRGPIMRGQSISFSTTIMFQKEGRKIIRGIAKYVLNEDNVWGDLDAIYLNVGASQSKMGILSAAESVEPNKAEAARMQGSEIQQPAAPSVLEYEDKGFGIPPALVVSTKNALTPSSHVLAPSGTLTVTGNWSHYDRNGNLIPSRNFLVQLRRASDGAHLAFAYTDSFGNFSLGPVTNPGIAGVRVRVWTYVKYGSADPTGDELMVVPNGSSSDYANTFYSETSTSYVFPDGNSSIGSWYILRDSPEGTYPNAHAWYVKDDLDRGWRYPLPTTVGDSTVEWRFDSTVGTYYQEGEHIHLMGDDRKSPDTIIHELGHNVMYNVYGHTFPPHDCPAPHYVQLSSGIFCGWTEGWADFYALAVNGDPVFSWASGATLNLETPTWGSVGWDNGATVEGRVAGSLWDVFDSANDGSDYLFDGFSHIWTAFNAHTNTTFRHYWDDLSVSGVNSTAALDALYQNTIDYRVCNSPGAFALSSPSNGQNFNSATSLVTLSWGQSAGADYYDVYFGTSSSPGYWTSLSSTSLNVNVTTGQTYFWKIVARVNCNSSLTSVAGTWSFSVANPGSSTWTDTDIGVGADNQIRSLWNKTDGTAALWTVASNGGFQAWSYGPYSGWTAKAIAAGADNLMRVLWTHTNGTVSLYVVAANGTVQSNVYGPYAGWTATDIGVGNDNKRRVLWNNADGSIALWTINADGSFQPLVYGPYSGWTARRLAVGSDNLMRVLWTHTNGTVVIWTVNVNGSFQALTYGPYAGWTGADIGVGSDNRTRVLWNNTNGSIALWTVNTNGSFQSTTYGPYSGWTARSIAVGADNRMRVLWNHTNGTASMWVVNADTSFQSFVYGPY